MVQLYLQGARETLTKYAGLCVALRVQLQGVIRRQYREYCQEAQRSQLCAQGRAQRGLQTRQISASIFLEMFSTFLRKTSLILAASVSQSRAYLVRGSLDLGDDADFDGGGDFRMKLYVDIELAQ